MSSHARTAIQVTDVPAVNADVLRRITSKELFQHRRALEIDHEGRIYLLRVTQLNKLMLTA